MCLLVVCSPDSTPLRKELENSACSNPHGFGYAIVTPDGIITNRGMSSKKMIREFLELRKQYPANYAMFHARYATHGVKNEENCHPFKVSEDTYLAHNGILDVDIHATDKRSDTRIFAEDILPTIGGVTSLDDDNVWKILSKWSTGSKIAVLTTNPAAKATCYIINESAGHWDNNGMWWSNYAYKESGSWSDYIRKTPALIVDSDIMDDYDCPACGATPFEEANPYYCEMCFTCFDCNGSYGDSCLCYTPDQKYMTASGNQHKQGGWYYDKHFDF